ASKTGADFLFDTGALSEMANSGANALRTLSGELQANANEFDVWWSQVQARMQMAEESFALDLGPSISGALSEIASGFGAAAVGAGNFGDVILKTLGGFMQAFGASLIALGIGKKAFDKFSGPEMIAAGVILAAAGGALQASIKNKPDLSASGGRGGSSGSSRYGGGSVAGNIQDTRVTAETIIRGQDLYVVFSSFMNNNKHTKVGG